MTVYTSQHAPVELPECSVWDKVWSNPTAVSDDAIAVIDGVSGRAISRGDFRALSQRLAHGLVNSLNLPRGSVVGLFSPNSFYYHAIVLAVQCAGMVFSGANAAYTEKELAHQVGDSGMKVLLVHPALLSVALSATTSLGWSTSDQRSRVYLAARRSELGEADQAASDFRTLDDIISDELLAPVVTLRPKETVAYLGYSSGTSGQAKGVRTSSYNMTSVLSILEPLKMYKEDVLIALLPLNHIYGLTKLVHWPILHGTPIVILPKFDLISLCTLVQKYRITVLFLVPPIALALARHPEVEKYDLSSLRSVISGAAPLGPELEKELGEKLACEVSQGYGLTETSPTTHLGFNAPRGSIGQLLPMMQARLVDTETGRDAEQGKPGELWLSGPNVMLGYLNRPTADSETLVIDPAMPETTWLRTGDIAHVDTKGNFYISDRLKELIKVKGFQVPPAELEGTLLECPFVADVAVIGVWVEEDATEYPRAYIVLSAEGKAEQDPITAIHTWTKGKVAHYKQLKGGIKLVETIPKSPAGKILRRILRDEVKKEQASKSAREEAARRGAKL